MIEETAEENKSWLGKIVDKIKDGVSDAGEKAKQILNRFIDVRLHKSVLFYTIWKILNIPLCMRHFYMVNRSLALAWRMMRSLFVDAGKKDRVTREDFESLVIRNDYFKKR